MYPPGFEIEEREGKTYLQLLPDPDYYSGNIFEVKIKLQNDNDTLEAKVIGDETVKVWYNGELKWEKGDNRERIIQIVK